MLKRVPRRMPICWNMLGVWFGLEKRAEQALVKAPVQEQRQEQAAQ